MIYVTLGTQDKEFARLLALVDKLIDDKVIKEKVIVQSGSTKFKSKNMEIYDYLTKDEIINYMKESKYVITHGGVGSIFDALNLNKKVIAVARLSKYGEHHNDHQLQVVEQFESDGLILNGTYDLKEAISKVDSFKPKKYQSNNKNFVKLITDYIDKN